jgi:general secretion pathway protein L
MAATGGILQREINLDSLKAAALRFCAWERDQCRAMLPPSALVWLLGRGAREAVVKAGAAEMILASEAGAPEIRIAGAEIAGTSLDAALARRGLSWKSLAIVLEMPESSFLTRQFEAPVAALGHLPQMLSAEIERRTPFRREEVLLAQHIAPQHGAAPGGKAKALVRMALLRRDLIAPALEPSGLTLGDLAAIRAESAPGSPQPPTISVNAGEETDRRFRRAVLAMTALAALFAAGGLGATFWRQNSEAAALDARIADMSARAARVRQIADSATKESRLLAILRETRRLNAPLADLWEEISRVTPDSAYLTDFHLSESKSGERSVDLAGFAQSAVGLPVLFSQSKYFTEATLTAPITSDPKEKRESFSLRLKARAPVPAAGGGAASNDQPANAEARR